jgi:hypothetical protein
LALDFASFPLPINKLSSTPTRTLPPIKAADVAKRKLMTTSCHHRPSALISEELVGNALAMCQILEICTLATEDSKDGLHEE